ncbi:MAG: ABC transporter permease [Fimbriimonadaceae bacterium]
MGDIFSTAIRAIVANKLRSALTMLGVIIGVGSVITMIGIGEGTRQKSITELEKRGSNMISIRPEWDRSRASNGQVRLTMADVDKIRDFVPAVEYATGVIRDRGTFVQNGSNNFSGNLLGVQPEMRFIRNANEMHSGTWFTEADDVGLEQKAVLGYTVYEELFGEDPAVHSSIKINGRNFEVVGVVEFKGGAGWSNPDEEIYIPLNTAMKRVRETDRIEYISVTVMDSSIMLATEKDIEKVLNQGLPPTRPGEERFRVWSQEEDLAEIEQQSDLLGKLLAGIASVSLLVGGIGIMNIMLVSVTERTREIGLRKAIGAKRVTILGQFLFESIVMCVMGGAIGIALGYFAVDFVAGALQVPPIINPQAVTIAFAFSVIIGLFFGLWPAINASKLQPIEALRHE